MTGQSYEKALQLLQIDCGPVSSYVDRAEREKGHYKTGSITFRGEEMNVT